ncbi:hypothetical protein N9035_00970 [Akkermansiaceae bacterium]|nr:hypothetical protein [Akkermansiaceae bacterium]
MDTNEVPSALPDFATAKKKAVDAELKNLEVERSKKAKFIMECDAVLRRFLKARTLEERLPFMTKSRRSDAELKASSLAGSLPNYTPVGPEDFFRPKGRARSSYHTVIFEYLEKEERNQMMTFRLVSFAEGEAPRVQTDVFLDLFENVPGKLAEKPIKGPITMNVIIQTSTYCFVDEVPDADSKATISIRSSVKGSRKDLAQAFLRADSDLSKKLRAHVPAGTSAPVTLSLEWNIKEDPKRPYLEVARLNAMSW